MQPLIGKLIETNHLGDVIMTCPRLFHECASKIANGQIEKQFIEKDHSTSPPKGGRSAQLKRLLKLWSAFDRKAIALAIIRKDNTTNSGEAAEALARGWSKFFAPQNIDPIKGMQFIKENVIPMILEEHQLPKQSHIQNFLKRAKPSASGPDGIPPGKPQASPDQSSFTQL